jgi:hypothetical protein
MQQQPPPYQQARPYSQPQPYQRPPLAPSPVDQPLPQAQKAQQARHGAKRESWFGRHKLLTGAGLFVGGAVVGGAVVGAVVSAPGGSSSGSGASLPAAASSSSAVTARGGSSSGSGASAPAAASSSSAVTATGGSSSGVASLPGGVTGTCKIVWTFSSPDFPVYPTYAAAYQAAVAWDYKTGYNSMTAETGNYTPETDGNMPFEYPTLRVTASSTTNIGDVDVVFYDKSGTEAGSTQFIVNEILTADQSWSASDETNSVSLDEALSTTSPDVASCQVVGWTAPSQS